MHYTDLRCGVLTGTASRSPILPPSGVNDVTGPVFMTDMATNYTIIW